MGRCVMRHSLTARSHVIIIILRGVLFKKIHNRDRSVLLVAHLTAATYNIIKSVEFCWTSVTAMDREEAMD